MSTSNIFIGSVNFSVDGNATAGAPLTEDQLSAVQYVVSTNFSKNYLRDLLSNVVMKVNLSDVVSGDGIGDDFNATVQQRIDIVKSYQLQTDRFDLNRLQADADVGKLPATLSGDFGAATGADPIELFNNGVIEYSIALDRANNDANITVASALPKAIGKQVNLADNDERIFRMMVEPVTMRNLAGFGIKQHGGVDTNGATKNLAELIQGKSVAVNEERTFADLADVNNSAAPNTRELAHELLHLLFRDDPPTDENTYLYDPNDTLSNETLKKWVYNDTAGTLALNHIADDFRLQFVVVSELDIAPAGSSDPNGILASTTASPNQRIVAIDGADPGDGSNPINPKRVLIRYDFNFDQTNTIPGCIDPVATNYNALANTDDGTCRPYGCTDPSKYNYDASALDDDGSCVDAPVAGQMSVDMDYNQYTALTTEEQAEVEDAFVEDLATAAGVDEERITITGVESGSLVFKYEIANVSAAAEAAGAKKADVAIATVTTKVQENTFALTKVAAKAVEKAIVAPTVVLSSAEIDQSTGVVVGPIFKPPIVIHTTNKNETELIEPPEDLELVGVDTVKLASNLTYDNVLIYIGANSNAGKLYGNVSTYHIKADGTEATIFENVYWLNEAPFDIADFNERGVYFRINDVQAGDSIRFDLAPDNNLSASIGDVWAHSQLRMAVYYRDFDSGNMTTAWKRFNGRYVDSQHTIAFDNTTRVPTHSEKVLVDGAYVDAIEGCEYSGAANSVLNVNKPVHCVWDGTTAREAIIGLHLRYLPSDVMTPPAGMDLSQHINEKLFSDGTHSNAYVYSGSGVGVPTWQAQIDKQIQEWTTLFDIVSLEVDTSGAKYADTAAKFAAGTLDTSSENLNGIIPIKMMYRGPEWSVFDNTNITMAIGWSSTGLKLNGNYVQEAKCGRDDGTAFASPNHPIWDDGECLPVGYIPVINRDKPNYAAEPGDVLLGFKMMDSWGDGWKTATNAAHLAVYKVSDDTQVGLVGELFSDGTVQNRMLALENDVNYKMVMEHGYYPTEPSLEVYNVTAEGTFDLAAGPVESFATDTGGTPVFERYFRLVAGVFQPMYVEISADNGAETLKDGDIDDITLESPNYNGKHQLVNGCTNSAAANYDNLATTDDGTCISEDNTKTVAVLMEEWMSSKNDIYLQGGELAKNAMAELLVGAGITYAKGYLLTVDPGYDTSISATTYRAMPNYREVSYKPHFKTRVTFKVEKDRVVSELNPIIDNVSATYKPDVAISTYTTGKMYARSNVVDEVASGCVDISAANYNAGALADGGGCEYSMTVVLQSWSLQIDGSNAPVLTLNKGGIYTFDESDTKNAGYVFTISDTANGDVLGAADGIQTFGTPGTAGASTRYAVPFGETRSLRYDYVHSDGTIKSGNTITLV